MSIDQIVDERSVNPGETTILVVEDHPGTRAAIVALLQLTLRGCNLLTAESAGQALSLCESQSPAFGHHGHRVARHGRIRGAA